MRPLFQRLAVKKNVVGQNIHSLGVIMQYCKILKISPSKYKPPQTGNTKNPPLNHPSQYKPLGSLYLENFPQRQSKTKQNGKFSSSYKAFPINFEMQVSLRR